ncbi:MAG: hypothetical protein FWD68_21060 [Alphaproteobacteria bacterium]|nr:hypothetical protein [Alphaproteobacteria bacterium]
MSERCERVEICGFFNSYEGSSDATNQTWIRMFCCSAEKSAECRRKIYLEKMKEPPPDNMTPTGAYI